MPPGFDIELEHLERGASVLAGCDEAGRGALAGPLALGVVVFNPSTVRCCPSILRDVVRDSKQLSARGREEAFHVIRDYALETAVVMVSHRIVDRMNVNGATEHALRKALSSLSCAPSMALMDGKFSFTASVPVISVVRGDERSLSIAAASILAKVTRDRVMERLDGRFPGYSFAAHKGYGTAAHMELIRMLGPSPVHRLSYEPVKSLCR